MSHQHHRFQHDDMAGSGGVPLFSPNGTALTPEQREEIARKRGICVTCGIKTHSGKFLGKTPITNDRVCNGTCILCNPESVPRDVREKYERQFRTRSSTGSSSSGPGAIGAPPSSTALGSKFKNTAQVIANFQVPSASRSSRQRPSGLGSAQQQSRPNSSRSAGGSSVDLSSPEGGVLTAEISAAGPGLGRTGSNRDPKQFARSPTLPDENGSQHFPHMGNSNRSTSDISFDRSHSDKSIPGQGMQGVPKSNSHGSIQQQSPSDQSNGFPKIRPTGPDDFRSSATDDSWALVKALRDNRDKPDVLRRSLHGLRNHVDDPACALSELKDLMDTYRNDPNIVSLAIGAVWSVTSPNDDKKEEATECGVTECIIDAIRVPPSKGSIDAVEWAIGSLTCLAQSADNREFIVKRGGVEAVVDALRQYKAGPGIFEWSCRLLYLLLHSHDSNNASALNIVDRNIATLDEAGGVPAIIEVMKIHAAESVAQWWALKVLWCLQDVRDEATSERFLRKFNDEDGMSVCAKILKYRSTTKESFRQACELLYKLLVANLNQPSSAAIDFLDSFAADCVPTCARMISENHTDPSIQASCFRLLSGLAMVNDQCKRAIADSKCVRAASTVLTQHIKEAALIEATVQFLWVVSGDTNLFDYAVVGSLKVSVDRALSLYKDKSSVICSACGLISNLCLSERVTSFTDIPINSLSKMSATATADPIVSQQVCRVFASICSKFPESVDRMNDDSLVRRLVEGLCNPDITIQSLCSNALASIASQSEEKRELIYSEGCVSTASSALVSAQSPQLVESLLNLISALVASSSKPILQLPSGTIENIIEAVQSFPAVQQTACVTIRNAMIVSVPGFSVPNIDGIIDMTTRIIDSPSSNVAQIIEACGTIWAFTAKQVKMNTSQLSRLFQSLTRLMETYKGELAPFNPGLQTAATGAMSGLMQCLRQNPIHISGDDVDLIISILDLTIERDVENEDLMLHVIDILHTLSFLTKDLLIQYGVIVVVIDSMVEHEQHELIQQKGCGILALLASTENLQVNLSIAETDGIDMIVSALAIFSDNVELQLDACRALSHLSIDHESRMLISSQGGLILLVNAMANFQDDIELLEAACSALLNLSSDAEEQVLAGSNVVDIVVKTMRHHQGSARIQEKGLGVLQNVSMRSRDAKKAIADSGGVNAVTFAIREFMGSPAVLERAFTTMWSLAVLDENQIRIAECGGIGFVVNGMMANISYERVQKQACGCLCTLSSNSANKTLIRDAGGVDSIVYAMWAHYNSEGLQVEACRALSSLAVNVQTNEVMIATDGEISAILSAMRRFSSSERLQEHACVALRNFLLSADNANLVRHNADDVRQLMEHASNRFPHQCAERARQVLASLV